MKFTLDSRDDINLIRAYAPGEVHIGAQVARAPCIVTAAHLILDWTARNVATLGVVDLAPLFELQPDVVLLGTGAKQTFPASAGSASLGTAASRSSTPPRPFAARYRSDSMMATSLTGPIVHTHEVHARLTR